MATTAKDLTIDLKEARPGQLAKALDAIAKAGVNLDGLSEQEGVLHVAARDTADVRRAVEGAGFTVRGEREVLVTEIADRPGEAAKVFRKIADANANVEFAYLATNTRLVIGAKDLARAREALGGGQLAR